MILHKWTASFQSACIEQFQPMPQCMKLRNSHGIHRLHNQRIDKFAVTQESSKKISFKETRMHAFQLKIPLQLKVSCFHMKTYRKTPQTFSSSASHCLRPNWANCLVVSNHQTTVETCCRTGEESSSDVQHTEEKRFGKKYSKWKRWSNVVMYEEMSSLR